MGFKTRSVPAAIGQILYSIAWNGVLMHFVSRAGRRKVETYGNEFRPIIIAMMVGLILLVALTIISLRLGESAKQWVLAASTIVSVVLGVFMQQAIVTIITPPRDVMHPVQGETLFQQFHWLLQEFQELIATDPRIAEAADASDAEVLLLLNAPVYLTPAEARALAEDKDAPVEFVETLRQIFGSQKRFTRKLITLSSTPNSTRGPAPLSQFIRRFAGYLATQISLAKHKQSAVVSSALPLENREAEEEFYKEVSALRQAITYQAMEISQTSDIRRHWYVSTGSSLQWQAVAIRLPGARYFRAAVSFYGDEYFRANSWLGLLGQLQSTTTLNQSKGFITQEPDIVDWVIEALIQPFDTGKLQGAVQHRKHSSLVKQKMANGWSSEGSDTESSAVVGWRERHRIKLQLGRDPTRLLVPFEYPRFDDDSGALMTLATFPGLFHPLVGESALWTSENLPLPAKHPKVEVRAVLDMCSGTGVQGIVAAYKGADLIHFVDSNPLALLCSGMNFLDQFPNNTKSARLTLADVTKEIAVDWDQFEEKLRNHVQESDGDIHRRTAGRWDEICAILTRLKNADCISYASGMYDEYDLAIVEPPFVDEPGEASDSLDKALFDPNFHICRRTLLAARQLIRCRDDEDDVGSLPTISFSFSALESEEDLERFMQSHGLEVSEKHVREVNEIYWYVYHLRRSYA